MAKRLTKALRTALLDKLSNAHDIDSSCAALGVTEAQLEAGGAQLERDIDAAYRRGTSKLRARLLELSLSNQDANVLSKLVDKRELADTSGSETITVIERIVVNPPCWKCGAVQPLPTVGKPPARKPSNGQAHKTNGQAAT